MESQVLTRNKSRGRKADQEKRKEETYKEKVQGTQPTLERVLSKVSRAQRNQRQGPRGGPSHSRGT